MTDLTLQVLNASASPPVDRRASIDRRTHLWRAVILGGWYQRRRNLRRDGSAQLGSHDWHEPQWLAAALLIMLLSVADAVMTLTLLSRGAVEINPIMRLVVLGDARSFVYLKMTLTAVTVTMLVLLTRLRTFGCYLAGPVLLLTALSYTLLVSYEYWLVVNPVG